MKELILQNRAGNYKETLVTYDRDSFKYTYSKNGDRQIEFTAYKATGYTDLFDNLVNENYIIYNNQMFVIKQSSIKYDGGTVLNELICMHVYMEFRNHFVDKDIMAESLNEDETEDTEEADETGSSYTLDQYLEYGFKDNGLGFEYEIVGDFTTRGSVSELGGQNGLEYIIAGAEMFGYIYFADNKKIKFYKPEDFYKSSDSQIIFKGNSSEAELSITTTDLVTYRKGYGKRKTISETKNYNPVLPKDLKLTGTYNKDGTWYTTGVGNTFSKTFTCKHGSEVLTFNNKKAKYGGNVDLFLDGEKIGTFSQYSKNAITTPVIVARNMEKGEHVFKAVFKGARSGVNYNGHTPRMYVNTAKGKVLNLVAQLKGSEVFYATAEYFTESYKHFGKIAGETLFSDTATTKDQLMDLLVEGTNDQPTVELTTNYFGEVDNRDYIMGFDDIQENSKVRFIHRPLNLNLELKIVGIEIYHPSTQKPSDVQFSSEKQDIVSINSSIEARIKRSNNLGQGGWNTSINNSLKNYTDVIGSVLIDD